jgi:hypothetical protein
VILDAQPNPARVLRTDLSAYGVTALLDGDLAVVDFATYQRDEKRCFAVIVEPRIGDGSTFFPALCREEVRNTLRPHGVLPTRVPTTHRPAGASPSPGSAPAGPLGRYMSTSMPTT